MKKTGALNQPLVSVIAGMGHLDTLVVADAGLPIPPETMRIDLALIQGIPGFLETLRVVLEELHVERVLVAEELLQTNPHFYQLMRKLLGETAVELIPHAVLKERTKTARAVVRTGEFTPYANIILVAGVVF
jgi:D-ribose pyranase